MIMRRATGIGITARRLIPGPLDHLVLFGSSLLVPKQRAVTSTGAYVLMDLGSASRKVSIDDALKCEFSPLVIYP